MKNTLCHALVRHYHGLVKHYHGLERVHWTGDQDFVRVYCDAQIIEMVDIGMCEMEF